jgi:hypothetical protein
MVQHELGDPFLRFRPVWLAMGAGFVLLVVYLSLTPSPPDYYVPEGQKAGHVLAYAWLMLWYAQLYRAVSIRIAFAAAWCLMGVGLEYLQGLTDYRSFSYRDMLLNAGGVALGFMLSRTRLQHGLATFEALLPRSQASR